MFRKDLQYYKFYGYEFLKNLRLFDTFLELFFLILYDAEALSEKLIIQISGSLMDSGVLLYKTSSQQPKQQ